MCSCGRPKAYCIKVRHTSCSEAVGDALRRHDGAHRMTVAHRLGNCHNVGDDVLRFECPVMAASTTKAHLHLIGNRNSANVTNSPATIKYLVINWELGMKWFLTCRLSQNILVAG